MENSTLLKTSPKKTETPAHRLHGAIFEKDVELMHALCQQGIDVNQLVHLFDNEMVTPLMACVLLNDISSDGSPTKHCEIAQILLEHGAYPNLPSQSIMNRSLLTPLGVAVKSKDYAMAKILLEHGADPNVDIRRGSNDIAQMVCMAVLNDDLKMLSLLLEHGADPNRMQVNDFGLTNALCLAAYENNIEIAKLLLKHKADPNAMDKDRYGEGTSALGTAVQHNYLSMVELLLAHGANPELAFSGISHHKYITPLYMAAQYGYDKIVKLLLATGKVNVNFQL